MIQKFVVEWIHDIGDGEAAVSDGMAENKSIEGSALQLESVQIIKRDLDKLNRNIAESSKFQQESPDAELITRCTHPNGRHAGKKNFSFAVDRLEWLSCTASSAGFLNWSKPL